MHCFLNANGAARAVTTALAVILAAPAYAADIEAKSVIENVTVYPDGATVTRVANVGLPLGASTVVFKGLPAAIDPASLRVAGQGSALFAIGSVEVRAVPGDVKSTANAQLEARIKLLRHAKDAEQAKVEAAEGKREMIKRFAAASPEKLSAEAKPLEVAQWAAAWDLVGDALAKVNEEVRALAAKVKEMEAEIEALEEAQPDEAGQGAPKNDVVVAVDSRNAVEGALALTYRVSGANWHPVYDARLDTGGKGGKPSLELIRRAQVAQKTGEDWTNVALTVSTVRVARGTAAPDLASSLAGFYEPPSPVSKSLGGYSQQPPQASRSRVVAVEPEVYKAAPQAKAEEQQAAVEPGGFQASFTVPGRVDVQQDGSPKAFRLMSRTLSPTLVVKSVPVVDEVAYLEASFTNDEEVALLPGEVAIHRDDTFVGRGQTRLVAPGDRIELGFGTDERVKVTRVPVRRTQEDPGILSSSKTDQREFKTTVKNLHTFPVRITIIDRVPFSENAAITIETLGQSTPPTERIVKDRRGVMAWTYDYAPGEQREIRFGYRLKWPVDKALAIDGRPQR